MIECFSSRSLIKHSEYQRSLNLSMTLRVQILHQQYDEAPDDLKDLLDPGITVEWGDPVPGKADFQILVAGRPSAEQLHISADLHSLIIPFAGIPAETRELVLRHFPSLPVHNLHHNAVATAEMAMALLFAVAKNLIPADRALRSHDWRIRYRPNENALLHGKRALVLGYGAVGRHIARLCRAVGLNVIALRRKAEKEIVEDGVQILPNSLLDDVLGDSDVVFVAMPLTQRTEGMINAERIEKLPQQCIVVNVARGPIIEERPFFEALQRSTIAGAGIDVWYCYPADEARRERTEPATFPFHELDNVVMSPHRAGGSRHNEELRLQHLASLLNSLASGETDLNRVDLKEGY
jgi:phosphoglycerate dehydrogenase-like enzyme